MAEKLINKINISEICVEWSTTHDDRISNAIQSGRTSTEQRGYESEITPSYRHCLACTVLWGLNRFIDF